MVSEQTSINQPQLEPSGGIGFSFEKSLERLQLVLKQLESGELSLEDALAHFEEGTELAKKCHSYLKQAEQKVEILMQSQQAQEIASEELKVFRSS